MISIAWLLQNPVVKYLHENWICPRLDKLFSNLSADDVLAVFRSDRLGRSLPHC